MIPALLLGVVAYAQPDNDNCEDAIEIFAGTNQSFDSTNGTLDGPEHPTAPCFSFGDDYVHNDIWFTYTSTLTGNMAFSTCNLAEFDTRVAIYNDGATCPLTDDDLLACNDDGSGCADFTSYVIFPVVEGGTYIIRLGGYADGDFGTGEFDLVEIVPPPVPGNDLCADAETIELVTEAQAENNEGWVSGTTIGASLSGDLPLCQNAGESQDVWYMFNSMNQETIEVRLRTEEDESEFFVDIFSACGEVLVDVENGGEFFDACIDPDEFDIFNTGIVETGEYMENTMYWIRVSSIITFWPAGEFEIALVATSSLDVAEERGVEYQLYPNPSNGNVTLVNDATAGVKTFRVMDAAGRVVMDLQQNLNIGERTNFDLSGLGSGMYLVQLLDRDGNSHGTSRLILE